MHTAHLHGFHMGYFLKPVKLLHASILSLKRISCATQLAVVCKLAEDALNPTPHVINKDIEQYWLLYRALRIPLITILLLDPESLSTTCWIWLPSQFSSIKYSTPQIHICLIYRQGYCVVMCKLRSSTSVMLGCDGYLNPTIVSEDFVCTISEAWANFQLTKHTEYF